MKWIIETLLSYRFSIDLDFRNTVNFCRRLEFDEIIWFTMKKIEFHHHIFLLVVPLVMKESAHL